MVGFEPTASWSQTKRASQTAPHPEWSRRPDSDSSALRASSICPSRPSGISPPWPGVDAQGVLQLRTLDDAAEVERLLAAGARRAVVVAAIDNLVKGAAGPVDGAALFHGNLVQVYHGRPVRTVFRDPADPLLSVSERHYERNPYGEALLRLPEGPLAYRDTPPGGEVPPGGVSR